jgi:hypothetical protein
MTTTNGTLTSHDSKFAAVQSACSLKPELIGLLLNITFFAIAFALFLAGISTLALAQTAYGQTDYSQAVAQHPDWAQIPGALIRRDCVHVLPKGATVEIDNDGQLTGNVTMNGEFLAHYDACSETPIVTRPHGGKQSLVQVPSAGNGWVEDDQWNAPLNSNDNIDYLDNTWAVPSYPTSSGALIYLFNGISPPSETYIIQPVLQYGNNGMFGGNYWGIASWLVGPTQAFVSPFETVNPGDRIHGYTQMTGQSGNVLYYSIVANDDTSGAYSVLNVWTRNLQWTWAYRGVLEAYNVNSCANFPASKRTVFGNTIVDHDFPYYRKLTPNWTGGAFGFGGPSCFYAIVAASGTLDY